MGVLTIRPFSCMISLGGVRARFPELSKIELSSMIELSKIDDVRCLAGVEVSMPDFSESELRRILARETKGGVSFWLCCTTQLSRRAALLVVGRMKLGIGVEVVFPRFPIVLLRGNGALMGCMRPWCLICTPDSRRSLGFGESRTAFVLS